MSRPWAARVAALAMGLVVALVGAEGAVRLAAPQPPAIPQDALLRGMFTVPGDHPVRTTEYGNVVHVNTHGFVDAEWAARRPGVPRIVVIGDSFVQAAQVSLEQGYGRQLARDLSQRAGHQVEVLSLGVPGAGTGTALLLLQQQVPALQPDVVVYGFTTSNDVLNNDPELDPKPDKPFFRLEGGQLVRVAPQDAAVPAWAHGLLWEHSELARWLGRTWWRRAESQQALARGEGLPPELRVHDPDPGRAWTRAWTTTDALVGALARSCQEHGWAFGTVLIPDGVEATVAGRAQAVRRWPELGAWDTDAAHLRAGTLAARYGPVVDLSPALRAAEAPDQPLYLVEDGHWTPRGHTVAAEASVPLVLSLLATRSTAP